MKLRSKIILSLLAISLVPLILSLWVVGGMATSSLEEQLRLRADRAALFIV